MGDRYVRGHVVLEALQLLWERDRTDDQLRLQELPSRIAIWNEQIAQGQVTDGDIVLDRLIEKIKREYQV